MHANLPEGHDCGKIMMVESCWVCIYFIVTTGDIIIIINSQFISFPLNILKVYSRKFGLDYFD